VCTFEFSLRGLIIVRYSDISIVLSWFVPRSGVGSDQVTLHVDSGSNIPEQNGAAERLNRTLNDRARAMLLDADVDLDLWAEAMLTANYIRNRSPASGVDRTPWEMFHGEVPDVSGLASVAEPKGQ
jgi:hypothetical protein